MFSEPVTFKFDGGNLKFKTGVGAFFTLLMIFFEVGFICNGLFLLENKDVNPAIVSTSAFSDA